jgi:hypothetical protein
VVIHDLIAGGNGVVYSSWRHTSRDDGVTTYIGSSTPGLLNVGIHRGSSLRPDSIFLVFYDTRSTKEVAL